MKAAPTGIDLLTPLTFSRASGVILFYGDLVLLSKRITFDTNRGVKMPVPYGGYWSPFAGAVEEGESPIGAAARELWEESGLKVGAHELKYIREIPKEGGGVFILYANELDNLFAPSLNFEHTEYGYFKIDSLQASPSPVCPRIVEAIQDFNSARRWLRPLRKV
jgi:8-oxo-dGTP pyrophosphatase MutT (NUDIX family)